MNKQTSMAALAVATASLVAAPAYGQPEATLTKNCRSVVIADTAQVTLGKSSVIPLAAPVIRIVVSGQPRAAAPVMAPPAPTAPSAPANQIVLNGQPQAAAPAAATPASDMSIADMDVLLLSPTDLFLRGKKAGSTNLILQDTNGVCYLHDIVVTLDPATLQAKLAELMPRETSVIVKSAENAIVLTGEVKDAATLDEVLRVATAYGDGKRVVNMMRVPAPQQVMLEVKIAEVSKTLLDKFGIDFSRMFTSADGLTSKALSGLFGAAPALLSKTTRSCVSCSTAAPGSGSTLLGIDAQKKDGLVRVLAQPNIMAISGQSASFLSGGKIFIPVSQSQGNGIPTITLAEKEFGVGLKFLPTVLDGNRINLKLVSEASELAQTGSPFTTVGGTTSVLPSITTRSIDTTVQLNDGQSFAVAGLIRNNVTESLSRFPILGDLPILGALFRSTEFQKDQTELIFVITPRLVKPAANFALPTDNHVEPNSADVILMGRAEGSARAPVVPQATK